MNQPTPEQAIFIVFSFVLAISLAMTIGGYVMRVVDNGLNHKTPPGINPDAERERAKLGVQGYFVDEHPPKAK